MLSNVIFIYLFILSLLLDMEKYYVYITFKSNIFFIQFIQIFSTDKNPHPVSRNQLTEKKYCNGGWRVIRNLSKHFIV